LDIAEERGNLEIINYLKSKGAVGGTISPTTGIRSKIISTSRGLIGTPFVKYTSLTISQKAEVNQMPTIWTWKNIPVIQDYDKAGSINCFDSVSHVYKKAGVQFAGFKYCLKDLLVDVDNDGCQKDDSINKDGIEEGDILSIRYLGVNHNVLFIRWVDKSSGKAEVLDWIGMAEQSQFPTSWTGPLRKFRSLEVVLKFEGKSEDWTVYAIGKPVIA
jgi:hypothetical protein